MICRADNIKWVKSHLWASPCKEEVTMINYEHYKEELEGQPEIMERIGKFYPVVKENPGLKLLRFDNNTEANNKIK